MPRRPRQTEAGQERNLEADRELDTEAERAELLAALSLDATGRRRPPSPAYSRARPAIPWRSRLPASEAAGDGDGHELPWPHADAPAVVLHQMPSISEGVAPMTIIEHLRV